MGCVCVGDRETEIGLGMLVCMHNSDCMDCVCMCVVSGYNHIVCVYIYIVYHLLFACE